MLQDFLFALREMRRSPGFALAAILSLSLGIGVNAAIFTLTNALFLKPLPVANPERLTQLETVDTLTRTTGALTGNTPVSLANLRDIRTQNTVFSGVAGFAPSAATLGGRPTPRRLPVNLVSANFFDVLGVPMIMGRVFPADSDDRPGATPQAVLSYSLWTTEFGADPSILGRKILLNSAPFVVVGVAPQGFKGTSNVGDPNLIWVPLSQHHDILSGLGEELFDNRRFRLFNVIGRLQSGVTLEQANAQVKTIAARLEQQFPLDNKGRTIEVSSVDGAALGFQRGQLRLINAALLGAASLVLLIACVNVANLLLVRAAARAKELGVRSALGAGRGRLVRQLLTESLLLSGLGALAGLALASWAKRILWSFRPSFLNINSLDLAIDPRVLAFATALAIITGLLFGLAPALRASRPDLNTVLRSGGDRGTTATSVNLRGSLVAFEVAFCLVALAGAGLFVRSMQRVQHMSPGFQTEHLFAFDFDLSTVRMDAESGRQFAKHLVETAQTSPGAVEAGLMSSRPLGGGALFGTLFKEGQRGELGERGVLALFESVSPSSFSTLRIPTLQGRLFTDFDRANTTAVAVINQAFAKQVWPGQNPVGKRFFRLRDPNMREVVGVVGDTAVFQIGETPQPTVYMPLEQLYQSGLTLMVRTTGDPGPTLAQALRTIQPLQRELALSNPTTGADMVATGLWAARMGAALFGLFGLLGLTLACIGVYGVVSFQAAERTKEMGIRLALGSTPGGVIGLVMRHGMIPALAGIAIGSLGALAFGHMTASLLFEAPPFDPWVLLSMAALLAGAAAAASVIPAWRAARIDPSLALRQ